MRLFWDIESNGLLHDVSVVHCICAVDLDAGFTFSWGPKDLGEALKTLTAAKLLVAHNGIAYDHRVMAKLYGWDPRGPIRRDTLILARLKYPNLKVTDTELVQAGTLPRELHGKNSLEAWGHRVGLHKTDYQGGWSAWSQEMQDYCLDDCRTGAALWQHLEVD